MCNFNHNLDKFHRSIQCPELPTICKCWNKWFSFWVRFWNAIPQSSMICCSSQAMILDRSSSLNILQTLHLQSNLRISTIKKKESFIHYYLPPFFIDRLIILASKPSWKDQGSWVGILGQRFCFYVFAFSFC